MANNYLKMKISKLQLIKEGIKHRSLISKIPSIFRMFKLWIKGQYTADFKEMILPLLGVIYIISPIDIIPGFLAPFIGALDDLAVLSVILPKLTKNVNDFLFWEAQKDKNITTIETEILE